MIIYWTQLSYLQHQLIEVYFLCRNIIVKFVNLVLYVCAQILGRSEQFMPTISATATEIKSLCKYECSQHFVVFGS